MYKCRECKALYREKVEYCDCGNNTFDEVQAPQAGGQTVSQAAQQTVKKFAKTEKTEKNDKNVKNWKNGKSVGSAKPSVDKLKRKSEFVSWMFFLICVSLSACIWLFAWNVPKQHKINPKPQNAQMIKHTKIKDIPNIDRIWDNTPTYKPSVTSVSDQTQVVNSEPVSLNSEPYPRR